MIVPVMIFGGLVGFGLGVSASAALFTWILGGESEWIRIK